MFGADINLAPPVVESGRFHDLVKAGQTVSASWSPSSNSLAVFLTNTVCLAAFRARLFVLPNLCRRRWTRISLMQQMMISRYTLQV